MITRSPPAARFAKGVSGHARVALACGLACVSSGACSDARPSGGDVQAASSGSAAASAAELGASTRPITSAAPASSVRTRWDARHRPRTGLFVGDESEDFVGVLSREDDQVELFAVDGATGRVAWSRLFAGAPAKESAFPFAAAGKLVAWAQPGSGTVHVLDAVTGGELRAWTLRDGQVVERMCSAGHAGMVMVPQPGGYRALLDLEDGSQPNNSGLYPGPACVPRGPDRHVPQWVRERLPPALSIGLEPAYAYEPGRVVARARKGRGDPVLVALGPAGNPRWQTPLHPSTAEDAPPLAIVDVESVADTFVVLGNQGDVGTLIAIDIEKGSIRWTKARLCRARWLLATETRAYVATDAGRLHVFDPEGQEIGAFGGDDSCPSVR